ncbi:MULTISPECIES: tripartite tricarboxylate transporter substrate-binding protein [unclassified Cupriavidus]|uniref:Bug family tripartite tricarboxylate transporter substrate binding protein n=1 Tax=unclassified Cupriavidus TaxID=2640874 RepID=UPI001BFFFA7D|nr:MULTISPECIES: tripartite tricarboxylate transporter substrate-binding protein [unclassified Cupriavidus]MCA3185284.1 tripartite tricarboxylate transporter substrate binding protein [Cupriavidus sp.]MCA3190140.1 tripartite tricarboxylate transporter substrate binding protein [Cupriavidus sp.]MCA3197591.1 tripartite tricarboxylate transporter substrate binding protein [Cupriavidus sp.]MCA3201930.1 tripartite tricarboxylate transporter substrate binding protein [Cupriavidus sp.]MCA3208048.1 tr
MHRTLARFTHVFAASAALAAAVVAAPAYAVDNLKVMIGANPGGGYDQTGRSIGAAMVAAGTAKTASYDNKGGAGGTIGLTQFVNTDKGNPNALIVTGAVMVGAIETNHPPVTLKNATPIARLFADTMVITVPASSPIKSMKDLTTQLKANPGSVSWGGGSKGSIDHILAGLIAKDIGVDPKKINYVPFQGGGEASASILGGHVTVGIAGVSEFLPFIKTGKMRALAVTSKDRTADIPTLKEQGVNVEIYNWRGVYGAPGITADQRKAMIDAVVKGTENKVWKDALQKNDWTPFLLTGDEFGKFVEAESTRLGATLRELGVAK